MQRVRAPLSLATSAGWLGSVYSKVLFAVLLVWACHHDLAQTHKFRAWPFMLLVLASRGWRQQLVLCGVAGAGMAQGLRHSLLRLLLHQSGVRCRAAACLGFESDCIIRCGVHAVFECPYPAQSNDPTGATIPLGYAWLLSTVLAAMCVPRRAISCGSCQMQQPGSPCLYMVAVVCAARDDVGAAGSLNLQHRRAEILSRPGGGSTCS
jgi:hypothetical protein